MKSVHSVYTSIHSARLNYLYKQIHSLGMLQSGRVLDVGCYPPLIYNFLKKNFKHVHGVASAFEPVTSGGIKIANIEQDRLPYPDNYFNLVIFTEVIEHLTNPNLVISEIYRTLKPNGLVIVTTPNVFRFQNIINLIFRINIYFPLEQLDQPINFRHQREYSKSELFKIFDHHKFHLKKSNYFIAYPPFRAKNQADSHLLKLIKYSNFLLSLLMPACRDSLYGLFQK